MMLAGLCTHAEGHARDTVVQRRLHLHVCEQPRSNCVSLCPRPFDRAITAVPRGSTSYRSPLLGLYVGLAG